MMTAEQVNRIIRAARALLARIDNITTDDFMRGGERLEREALRSALAAIDGARTARTQQ